MNNVIHHTADAIIASDVISLPTRKNPSAVQVVAGAMQVMINAATQRNFKQRSADFIFNPDTNGIDAFDFRKIPLVLQRGEEALAKVGVTLKEQLQIRLN